MKKTNLFIVLFVFASFLMHAQSYIYVQSTVFINDKTDRTIDSMGNVGIRIHCDLWRIYYHCLYISIRVNDLSIFDRQLSPFFVRFKNTNDTVPAFICDSVTQNTDGSILVWLVAPFDRSSNVYQHIESRNFSAPYYLEEKTIYHRLCSYPSFLEDFFDINEIKDSENMENIDFEYDNDIYEN